MFDIKDKKILLTGATGYLGREIALLLAARGAHIYVNSRTFHKCEELASLIINKGGKATVACFDITIQEEIINFINSINVLDIIINNSYAGSAGTIETSLHDQYLSSYNSALAAPANLFKMLLPALRKGVDTGGYASVINISSMYGIVSPNQKIYDSPQTTNPPFYGAAKAALIQWTKYAACEFANENIRINCISPGAFPSKESQKKYPEMISNIIKKTPLGRIGYPKELVGAIIFLSSPASSFITGSNICVDGGWTCW